MRGSKNFLWGKPPNPIFGRFARICFQHPKFLFKRTCSYYRETAKGTTQRQHRVSYTYVWFRVDRWGNIVPVTVVEFSLNHGILATESVLEKSVPPGKNSVL